MKTHLTNLANSLLHPLFFFSHPPLRGFHQVVRFFLINLVLAAFVNYLYLSIVGRKLLIPFIAINQLLFTLPVVVITILVFAGALFVIGKLLRGQATLMKVVEALLITSGPMVVSPLPIISRITAIYQLFLLIVALKFAQNYSWTKATINVLLPGVVILVLMALLSPV